MVHQPRRTASRLATLALCGALVVGLLLGMSGTPGGGGEASAASDPAVDADLPTEGLVIYEELSRLRADAGLPALTLDEGLVESAERDACAMARGDLQLSGSEQHMTAAGAERENVGLVVDADPLSAARTVHEWWSKTPEHRVDRTDGRMHRYGIGACSTQDRTYYVERFAS